MHHQRERIRKAADELSKALTDYGREVILEVDTIDVTTYDDTAKRCAYNIRAVMRVEIGDE